MFEFLQKSLKFILLLARVYNLFYIKLRLTHMLTNNSQNIDVPHNAQLFGAQECFKTMIGKEAPSWKHKELKIRLERKETLEQEQENAQRDAYKEQVFTTHQQVSLLTQRTQVLADKESKQMLKVVSGCK